MFNVGESVSEVWNQEKWNSTFNEADVFGKGEDYTLAGAVESGSAAKLTFYASINGEWKNRSPLDITINGSTTVGLGDFLKNETLEDAEYISSDVQVTRKLVVMDEFYGTSGSVKKQEQVYNYELVVPAAMVTGDTLDFVFSVPSGHESDKQSAIIGDFTGEQGGVTITFNAPDVSEVWDQEKWNSTFNEADVFGKGEDYTLAGAVESGSAVKLSFYASINDEWRNKSLQIDISGEVVDLGNFQKATTLTNSEYIEKGITVTRTLEAFDEFYGKSGGDKNRVQVYYYELIFPADMVTSDILDVGFSVSSGSKNIDKQSAVIGDFTVDQDGGPRITGDTEGTVTEDAVEILNVSENGEITYSGEQLVASGKLNILDDDKDEAKFKPLSQTSTYGTFDMDETGAWTYELDNTSAAVQALVADQTQTDEFTVTSYDGTAEEIVSITVKGKNDVASIDSSGTHVITGEVTEDHVLDTASGTLGAVSDADKDEAKYTPLSATGTYGTFEMDETGAWTYTLDNSLAAVQALGAGYEKTEDFTVTSYDGTASEKVTITVKGAEDVQTYTIAETGYSQSAFEVVLDPTDGFDGDHVAIQIGTGSNVLTFDLSLKADTTYTKTDGSQETIDFYRAGSVYGQNWEYLRSANTDGTFVYDIRLTGVYSTQDTAAAFTIDDQATTGTVGITLNNVLIDNNSDPEYLGGADVFEFYDDNLHETVIDDFGKVFTVDISGVYTFDTNGDITAVNMPGDANSFDMTYESRNYDGELALNLDFGGLKMGHKDNNFGVYESRRTATTDPIMPHKMSKSNSDWKLERSSGKDELGDLNSAGNYEFVVYMGLVDKWHDATFPIIQIGSGPNLDLSMERDASGNLKSEPTGFTQTNVLDNISWTDSGVNITRDNLGEDWNTQLNPTLFQPDYNNKIGIQNEEDILYRFLIEVPPTQLSGVSDDVTIFIEDRGTKENSAYLSLYAKDDDPLGASGLGLPTGNTISDWQQLFGSGYENLGKAEEDDDHNHYNRFTKEFFEQQNVKNYFEAFVASGGDLTKAPVIFDATGGNPTTIYNFDDNFVNDLFWTSGQKD